MTNADQLTPRNIYEMVAELGFRKYFHFGGIKATQELLALIPFDETKTVLEVGCASGKTSCYLARNFGCKVTGIDLLPGMVARANEWAIREGVETLVEFRVGDAQELSLEDDSYDIVIGEFITGLLPDKVKAIKAYCRVLKPGGVIGLNEATWIKIPPPPGLKEFLSNTVGLQGDILTQDGWRRLMEDAGIKDLTTEAHKVTTLKNPKDDLADLVRALPNVIKMYVRKPLFRRFLKMSVSMPDNLLEYFGYGLYVGKNRSA